MKNHRIRLAGPWESQFIREDGQPVGEVIRCQLPFTLPESQHESGVMLNRGFHCPTGINAATSLRIVLQSGKCPDVVRINGVDIPECPGGLDPEFAFEITYQIAEFNQLSVLFKSVGCESPTMLNTVWLEIQG